MTARELTATLGVRHGVARLTRRDWRTPLLLLLLSAIPVIAGGVRLADVGAGGPATPDNARFLASPIPIVLHVLGVTLYSVLGAFQFSAGFRRRFPAAHRRGGRVLVVAGLVAAASGIWMAHAYSIPDAMQGPLLLVTRDVVGVAMLASLVIAMRRIMRRDVAGHEAWMIRAYALGQGAGTQVVIAGGYAVFAGDALGLVRDVLLTASWLVNVAVAEWLVRRRRAPRAVALTPS
ncbi:MAG: DUF2306 domain-containing protein [Deltaproteobacteria bacterium]|nr:DUF2306 domain-containing protein [Deltaproteobacteria bacterium]